jgi:hypothetical protein
VSSRELSAEVKQLGFEVCCSTSSNADVKNGWGYTSSIMCLLGMHRDICALIYTNFRFRGLKYIFRKN